jgi:hypothetical protein
MVVFSACAGRVSVDGKSQNDPRTRDREHRATPTPLLLHSFAGIALFDTHLIASDW